VYARPAILSAASGRSGMVRRTRGVELLTEAIVLRRRTKGSEGTSRSVTTLPSETPPKLTAKPPAHQQPAKVFMVLPSRDKGSGCNPLEDGCGRAILHWTRRTRQEETPIPGAHQPLTREIILADFFPDTYTFLCPRYHWGSLSGPIYRPWPCGGQKGGAAPETTETTVWRYFPELAGTNPRFPLLAPIISAPTAKQIK